jgi:hypothetical protein
MTRKKNEVVIDCMALKRKAQTEIYEEIKGLSAEEEISYFRKKAQASPFAHLWKNISSRKKVGNISNERY